MRWLDKIFGNPEPVQRATTGSMPLTQQFDDEDDDDSTSPVRRNGPRRELLQVVLRDTMRRHGIPSDWIECRLLSVVSAAKGTGMHVLLVVKQGDDRLATYVHAFQHSFMAELLKFEPRARDWLFSISWQFDGKPEIAGRGMPDPGSWKAASPGMSEARAEPAAAQPAPMPMKAAGETVLPPVGTFAALDVPAQAAPSVAGPRADAAAATPGTVQASVPQAEGSDSELQEDLQALFAIRDAALNRDDTQAPPRDFEATQPGEDRPAKRTS
jgi:hypothetical protein